MHVETQKKMMKEDAATQAFHQQRKRIISFTRKNYNKPPAYLLTILFSYLLGYLSAPLIQQQQQQQAIINMMIPSSATQADDQLIAPRDHYQFSNRCSDPVPPKLIRQTLVNRIFNGISPFHNFPPPHLTPLILRQKRIKGWGSNGAVFENLIRQVKPKTIIEVGTFLGASAIHMAELTKQLGLSTQIICVDDFRGWPGFGDKLFKDLKMLNGDVTLLYQFMQNLLHMNVTDSVLFLPFSTASTLQKLCEWGVYADLIEVDAGHDFHSAWSDINRAYNILRRPGGVLFGHDYFTSADNKGVRRAVNLFARVNRLRVQVDGQHWVIHSNRS